MGNKYTRRQILKGVASAAVIGVGAKVGHDVGRKLTDTNALEGLVDVFYRATYDTLAEVTGAAEGRLTESIGNLKAYIGETQDDATRLQKYWDNVGLATPETFGELEEAVVKMEHYVQEADFGERMERLKDRLAQQAMRIDRGAQNLKPGALKRFDRWFAGLIKGKERGSKKALDKYNVRLGTLVDVYDSNRDNIVAQAALTNETSAYFAKAQVKIVAQVGEYLADPKISQDEKTFYKGLIAISKEDKGGRDLADYLLKTDGYFRTVGVIDGLEKLSGQIETSVKEIKTLQGLMDEGLALKNKIRKTGEVYPQMVEETRSLVSTWEAKRKDLADSGHKIDYDLYPRITSAKDNVLDGIDSLKQWTVWGATGAGAVVGAYASKWFNRATQGSDKKFGKKVAGELAQANGKIKTLEAAAEEKN